MPELQNPASGKRRRFICGLRAKADVGPLRVRSRKPGAVGNSCSVELVQAEGEDQPASISFSLETLLLRVTFGLQDGKPVVPTVKDLAALVAEDADAEEHFIIQESGKGGSLEPTASPVGLSGGSAGPSVTVESNDNATLTLAVSPHARQADEVLVGDTILLGTWRQPHTVVEIEEDEAFRIYSPEELDVRLGDDGGGE